MSTTMLSRIRTAIGPFVGMLAAVLVAFGIFPLIGDLIASTRPPENWVSMTNFRAEHAELGTAPIVTADRIVHREVLTNTRVTLRRLEADGQSVFVCSRASERHYVPDSDFPEPLTLNYWAESPPNLPCLPETTGPHIVTLWVGVEGDAGLRTAPITLKTEPFCVYAKGRTPEDTCPELVE